MLDICLLGTGGMLPLPNRALTSLMLRYNGHSLLIDCGEGTQNQIRLCGWSFKDIDMICFTHFHADHISGLPGLLLTIGNADRTEPLKVVGPKGLIRVVNALRIIAPGLPFDIEFEEFEESEVRLDFYGMRIEAYKVNHSVTCYGYTMMLDRLGLFNVEAAKALDLPVQYWGKLQHGETVEYEGRTYTPDMVMGEARKGLKITYCTDTRPMEVIVSHAAGSDLFICEGMYGEEDKLADAKDKKHMTMQEACGIAKEAGVRELWLTHYSPATVRPQEFQSMVSGLFETGYICRDGRKTVLKFED